MKLNYLLWVFFGLLVLKYTAYPLLPLWLLLTPLVLYLVGALLISYVLYYYFAPIYYKISKALQETT